MVCLARTRLYVRLARIRHRRVGSVRCCPKQATRQRKAGFLFTMVLGRSKSSPPCWGTAAGRRTALVGLGSMLAHDGSTNTPTATATALALAMMLAFAPVGDAQAAVGDCYGVRYDGLCYGVGSIEVSKEHVSSSAPTRRSQVQGQDLTAEEDVKALQARVATIEMTQKPVRVPLALPAPAFAFFLACNVAGGALAGVLLAPFGVALTPSSRLTSRLLAFGGLLLVHPVDFQRMIGYGCWVFGYPALAAAIRFVRAFLSEINSNEKDSSS